MVDRVEIVTGVTDSFKGDEPALKEMEAPKTEAAQQVSERPQWLPEKFQSAEDMAKAYAELEKRLGSQPKAEEPAADKAKTEDKQAKPLSNEAFKKFSDEFYSNGSLSDQSYAELANLGMDRSIVDAYIQGQRAMAERQAESVYATVGGKDAYAQMVQWGQDNLSEAEISAFNSVVRSGDMSQINLAVQGIHSRMKAEGKAPTLLHGKSGNPTTAFRSTAEVVEAMRDPRYSKDSAYRADVETRLKNSNII